MSLWNVHALAVADLAAVSHLTDNVFAFEFFDLHCNAAVVNENSSAGTYLGCQFLICDTAFFVIAADFIGSKSEQLSFFQNMALVSHFGYQMV